MPLSSDDRAMVDKFQTKLEEAMVAVRKWQHAINAIYEVSGEEPPYDVEAVPGAATAAAGPRYRPDEFYGVPLAGVVRRLLEDHGGLTDDRIFELMKEGGFKFEGSEAKARGGLRISLGKNQAFDKTTSGVYVLNKGTRSGRAGVRGGGTDAADAGAENGNGGASAEVSPTDGARESDSSEGSA